MAKKEITDATNVEATAILAARDSMPGGGGSVLQNYRVKEQSVNTQAFFSCISLTIKHHDEHE